MILHEIVRALERVEERQREILERMDREQERKIREENRGPREAAERLSGARTSDGASETCRLRQGEGCKVREDEWLQNGIDNILAYQAGKRKEE